MNQNLTLGTVQFGLNYGVSNKSGKVTQAEAESILDFAYLNGITELDTAVAYGDSETVLGGLANGRFLISTKLPKLSSDNLSNIRDWTKSQIESSLEKLKVNQIDTLFLHDVSILYSPVASELYEVVENFKTKGHIKKFGLSIYSYHELDKIPVEFKYNRIQCPINVFDLSLKVSGWMEKLREMEVEIQARSIFLQGVLLMEKNSRPTYFSKWKDLFQKWDDFLNKNQISPAFACILFIKSLEEVSNVVFGVETQVQLKEILSLFKETRDLKFSSNFESSDENLIYPYRWQLQ
ncbi:aldo/keto reductase [Leptospira sp. 96542]|nr:aldo/keto reductase [Leptospira sp. 96542]